MKPTLTDVVLCQLIGHQSIPVEWRTAAYIAKYSQVQSREIDGPRYMSIDHMCRRCGAALLGGVALDASELRSHRHYRR